MIVALLFLIDYLFNVVKARLVRNALSSNSINIPDAIQLLNELDFGGIGSRDDNVGVRFDPPAYSQRYSAVHDILVQLQSIFDIKKLVDVGCSQLSFFNCVKRLETIEEYIGVDIDRNTLEMSKSKVAPLNVDYLTRRCSPLKVSVLAGNATYPDVRLKYTNAIVAIELIEHLYPPDLDNLPYNIFGIVQPDVAIFTTPNADFNVLFTKLEAGAFRHNDHKFEWTRQQFEDWGNNIVLRYPGYEVWFSGIAKGPEGTEEFGCCSQVAVFIRKEVRIENNDDYHECYQIVHEVNYPFQTKEERFINILDHDVYHFTDRYSNSTVYRREERIEIPLIDIVNFISVPCTVERLKTYLEDNGKQVELKNNVLLLILPLPDEESLDDIIQDFYDDNEESWIIDNDAIIDDFMVNDESWSYVLETLNEMHPEPNTNFDEIDDDDEFNEEMHCSLRIPRDVQQNEPNISDLDVLCDPAHIGGSDVQLSDEEDLRPESVTPVGENQVQFLIDDNILQNSSSTGSGNTSKSSDTLVEGSLSPRNTIKTYTNDETSENNTLSTSKDFFSDLEHPCSSSRNDDFEIPNIPDSFGRDDNPSSVEVIKSETQKEINENERKQNEERFPVKEPDHPIDEISNVHHDQSSSLVTRSQSLENVNVYKCKEKSFRYSLNIDNKLLGCDTPVVDMELETRKGTSIPSLTETYGSHSKAVDSGYPNSTQDMELDLTPEQVDEIITETESSPEDEDSSDDERVEPVHANPPLVFANDVENGDVANNNRDGEGNNMEGGPILQEELILEDVVMEGGEVEAEEVAAADGHESEDESHFLSALDVSNNTVVPEETSSNEDTVYLFDLPSPSSFASLQAEPSTSVQNQNEFPSWLLSMEVWDDGNGSGDAGPDRDEDSSDLVVDREGQVDLYPGDARAGGEPTLPDD